MTRHFSGSGFENAPSSLVIFNHLLFAVMIEWWSGWIGQALKLWLGYSGQLLRWFWKMWDSLAILKDRQF
jgi:hypothetical protein